jgi:coenzyme PQQ precursor peptide PqqA
LRPATQAASRLRRVPLLRLRGMRHDSLLSFVPTRGSFGGDECRSFAYLLPYCFVREYSFMSEVQREAWDTPKIEEIGLGFEITAYVNDSEFGR